MVNCALLLVGAEKLGSMTASTKSARLANAIYDECEDEIYDLPIDFKFTTSRAQLSRLSETPAFGSYDYYYGLPNDCRRIIAMCDTDGDTKEFPWRKEVLIQTSGNRIIQTDVILTNEETVYVKFIVKRDDPSKYPAWFRKLIILNIATYLAEPLKQDTKLFNKLEFMWDKALNAAKSANGMEDVNVNWDNTPTDKGDNDVIDAAVNGDNIQTTTIEILP